MYFPVFSSLDDNNNNNNNNDNNKEEDDNICIICWLPTNNNNKIINLKNIPHIITICKCNPKIHIMCFDRWLISHVSCPICRTKLSINLFQSKSENIVAYCYICYTEHNNKIFNCYVFLFLLVMIYWIILLD